MKDRPAVLWPLPPSMMGGGGGWVEETLTSFCVPFLTDASDYARHRGNERAAPFASLVRLDGALAQVNNARPPSPLAAGDSGNACNIFPLRYL